MVYHGSICGCNNYVSKSLGVSFFTSLSLMTRSLLKHYYDWSTRKLSHQTYDVMDIFFQFKFLHISMQNPPINAYDTLTFSFDAV